MTKAQRRRLKLTRHHLRPFTRSRDNRPSNILLVPDNIHQAYHLLFGDAMPWEAVAILRRDWTQPGIYGDRRDK